MATPTKPDAPAARAPTARSATTLSNTRCTPIPPPSPSIRQSHQRLGDHRHDAISQRAARLHPAPAASVRLRADKRPAPSRHGHPASAWPSATPSTKLKSIRRSIVDLRRGVRAGTDVAATSCRRRPNWRSTKSPAPARPTSGSKSSTTATPRGSGGRANRAQRRSAGLHFPGADARARRLSGVDASATGLWRGDGGQAVLFTPGQQALLDAVTVKTNSRGRFPDGSGDWMYPTTADAGRVERGRAAQRHRHQRNDVSCAAVRPGAGGDEQLHARAHHRRVALQRHGHGPRHCMARARLQ